MLTALDACNKGPTINQQELVKAAVDECMLDPPVKPFSFYHTLEDWGMRHQDDTWWAGVRDEQARGAAAVTRLPALALSSARSQHLHCDVLLCAHDDVGKAPATKD